MIAPSCNKEDGLNIDIINSVLKIAPTLTPSSLIFFKEFSLSKTIIAPHLFLQISPTDITISSSIYTCSIWKILLIILFWPREVNNLLISG